MFSRMFLSMAFTAALASSATAAVTAEEAKALGATLTEFGAEKTGNADGSIPPYSAEAAKIAPPSGSDPAKGVLPNPFADDKPLFTITQQNMAQYAKSLDEGAQTLLKRWPDFKINVYKTRRTTTYPDWVLKNTVANATRASLVNVGGDGVQGAYGGIPFPIPKSGLEVLWNHLLSWQPLATELTVDGYMVDGAGMVTELNVSNTYFETQYYNPDKTALEGAYNMMKASTIAPPRSVGEINVVWYSGDYKKIDQKAWVYSPGQRRVRLAPEFAYDTPAAPYGGVLFYDEIYMFSGRPDRFDWKLIGKKELYVPYNTYDLYNGSADKTFGPQHLNMDRVRYELHRVWEVEATLKPGARHAMSRRKFYFDEDSWKILATVGYDQAGQTYRIGNQYCAQIYDPKTPFLDCSFAIYDLAKNQYMLTPQYGDRGGIKHVAPLRSPSETTAAGMQGGGVR
ncbi:hypothetical protein AZL_b06130 (plasmid) [Azospirillum sp. B510]|nr:hypothetical protein AZL_b06130 [Azospirillum sp. B510]